ncbi:AsmA family protein [Acidipila sp. EB88]|uniref:AsmA family protein n=1 Tax=Acidipila sp. EB88 TaxID=2305226 RepID=UPI000F5ED1C1|nr:AsmA family protein [Acidipila sp. EB88]RRA48592.1 AsmA family protein [Acidipila sp. EB88]
MKRGRGRETVLLLVCILLLLLATIPPLINLGRFQHRIAGAISRSIGRPVSMDAISLRLLPWPAFSLDNLVVAEDPAFGAEPSLRAPSVLVEPRLASLWRGRFELSRVELADASVNLVRLDNGRWNISSVLLQASQIANAPTAQAHSSAAPRFPFIEATGTRINFKQGSEKRPYSLLNANFSMWLAEPTAWQIKLEAQPVRTDLDLSLADTGLLEVSGEVHRASAFGRMPLELSAEWSHAPLGQLSRLLLGRDAGWRGDIDATAKFQGEIDHLIVRSHLLISNLHQQDFTPVQPFTVDATCQGSHNSDIAVDGWTCRWPLGEGALLLTHQAAEQAADDATPTAPTAQTAAAGTQPGRGALTLSAQHVPASFLAQALGLLLPNAPRAQRFSGAVDGSFQYALLAHQLTGMMAVPALSIAEAAPGGAPLVIRDVALRAAPTQAPSLLVSAAPVSLGVAAQPLSLSAELSRDGFAVHANGAATLPALQAATAAMHLAALPQLLPVPGVREPAPVATVGLSATAPWLATDTDGAVPSAPAGTTGTLHLQNVLYAPAWLPAATQLSSVDALFLPGTVRWTIGPAVLGPSSAAIHFSGSVEVPLRCDPSSVCPAQFQLNTPAVDVAMLASDLNPSNQPLFAELLQRVDAARIRLPAVSGSIHAATLGLGRLPVRDASLVLSTVAPATGLRHPEATGSEEQQAETGQLPGGPRVTISSLDGQTVGGHLHLDGSLDWHGNTPHYTVRARLTGADARGVAALWHENWGPGTLSGNAEFTTTGTQAADLTSHMDGQFQASWVQGASRAEGQLRRLARFPCRSRISAAGTQQASLVTTASSSTGGCFRTALPLRAASAGTGRCGFRWRRATRQRGRNRSPSPGPWQRPKRHHPPGPSARCRTPSDTTPERARRFTG